MEEEVVDEAMRDWGRPVSLVRLERTYQPSTGEATVVVVEAKIVTGIVSTGHVKPHKGTAANDRSQDVLVLVRASDFGPPEITGRIVGLDEQWWEIRSIETRPGGVLALALVAKSPELSSGIESDIGAELAA